MTEILELTSKFRSFLDGSNIPQRARERGEKLVADLEKLATGWRPTTDELKRSARIDDWSVDSKGCLEGRFHRHPKIRSDRGHTSPVIVIDRQLRWMRTVSRFYELGEPSDGQVEAIRRFLAV